MCLCNEHDYSECTKQDSLNPYDRELIEIAKLIKRLNLKVRLTLDSEFAVQPFPAHPGDEIDDIENGFFRFGSTFIPISRVDIINLDFGNNKNKRDDVLRALAHLLESTMCSCNDYSYENADVKALRKLLLQQSRANNEIRTIDSVRPDMLNGSVNKEIGPIGFSTVIIPYKVNNDYLLAVLVLKNIRLIQFV